MGYVIQVIIVPLGIFFIGYAHPRCDDGLDAIYGEYVSCEYSWQLGLRVLTRQCN
jgi:hypothetical protein